MEVKVVKRPEIIIVGTAAVTKVAEHDIICKLWDSFEECSKGIRHQGPDVGYELHIPFQGKHYCLTGIEVAKVEALPLNCFAKTIPAGEYAVFTHQFSQGGFEAAFAKLNQWLKENAPDEHIFDLFEVQVYDHRFKGMNNPESTIDILRPLSLS